jgi:osmotically-inducible protein OsmY
MAESPALLIAHTSEFTGNDGDDSPATAQFLAQHLEDLRLAERVECALRATGYTPLRAIQVAVQARLVRLAGRVPSYYLKQVAQTTALAAPGAHQVRNDLDVGPPS